MEGYSDGGSLSSSTLNDVNVQDLINNIEKEAQTYWDTMDTSATRTELWDETGFTYVSGESAFFGQSYVRLRTMALAYAMDGSDLQGNVNLRDDIVDAMDWIYDEWYNPTIDPTPPSINNSETWPGNWYDYQIGSPRRINDIVILMYDDFTSTQIDNYINTILHYNPDLEYGGYRGTTGMLGGNLVWKSIVFALAGANIEDTAPLDEAETKVVDIFDYWTEYPDENNRSNGDGGFYEDGSFIQHYAHSYAGGYGVAIMSLIPQITNLLDGSPWEITDPSVNNLYSWIYDTYEPLIYKGAIMDMTRGRDISRYNSSDHVAGSAIARAILEIAQTAPTADKENLKAMVKHWIETDTYYDIYSGASINEIIMLNDLISDSSITARGELVKHQTFSMMNQVVHRRPGFAFGLSMHSNNIQNYESTNNENLRGWYQNAGTTYLYNDDLGHYSNEYWPTVNPYRMPGTTVDTRSLADKENEDTYSTSTWVGGTTFQSEFGTAGMELNAIGSSLTGDKSWFMFDDEIVALGSGITSTDNRSIETIVENRQLKSDASNALLINGSPALLTKGVQSSEANVDWMHLEGNVTNSDIGYYFPDSPSVEVLQEERSAKWNEINEYIKVNSEKTLNPVADAFVRGGSYDSVNYGTSNLLRVKDSSNETYSRKTYLKFDLSDIKSVEGSTLRIYGRNSQDTSTFDLKAYGVTDNGWTETGITWSNAPARQSTEEDTAVVNDEWKYYEWDVSSFVQSQLSNDVQTITLVVEGVNDQDVMFYAYSREDTLNNPGLVLEEPEYTRQYMNLWFDHGSNPSDAKYSYVLLPNQSSSAVSSYASSPDIEILSHNQEVHAVRENTLNITGVNFWKDNNSKAAGVQSDKKASVMFEKNPGVDFELSVSDPTMQNTGTIELELDISADSVIEKDTEITVVQLSPFVKLSVDVNDAKGKSFHIKLNNPQDVVILETDEDAFVQDGSSSTTNFGTEQILRVKDSPSTGYTRKSYLQFDLSELNSVSSAKLLVYGRNSESSNFITVNAYGVGGDSWSENTITWDNSPTANSTEEDAALVNDVYMYYEWDLTSLIQSEWAGDQVATIMLEGINDEDDTFYAYSKEKDKNRPKLVIE